MGSTVLSPEIVTTEREDLTPAYNVVLLDDDDHTYDYVIEMLQKLFVFSQEQAFNHAVEVDTHGRTILLTCALSEAEYAAVMEDNDKRIFDDSIITARVKAALLAEKGIPSFSISVETYEGRVQLSGFVKAPDIVSRVGRVTAGVNGVRTVHNNISVR